MSPLVPIPIILKGDSAECGGEFRTTFRTIPAFVAQWIEQRFPKPCAEVRFLPGALRKSL